METTILEVFWRSVPVFATVNSTNAKESSLQLIRNKAEFMTGRKKRLKRFTGKSLVRDFL